MAILLDKVLIGEPFGTKVISLEDDLLVEDFNMTDKAWKNISRDSFQRMIQRLVEDRLGKVLENGVVWNRNASTYQNPISFSVTGSDKIITISGSGVVGRVVVNGRLITVTAGDIDTGTGGDYEWDPYPSDDDYYLVVRLQTDSINGDSIDFYYRLKSTFDEQDPSHRNNEVRIAEITITGGNITSVSTFHGDLTGLPNKESIINDHIKPNEITYDKIVTVPDHDHSGDVGDGAKLDWDNVWSDAVHNHSSNAEGGQFSGNDALTDVPDHDHSGDAGDGGRFSFINSEKTSNSGLISWTGDVGDQTILSQNITIQDSSNPVLIIGQVSVTTVNSLNIVTKLFESSTQLQLNSTNLKSQEWIGGTGQPGSASIFWMGTLSAGIKQITLKIDPSNSGGVEAGGAQLIIIEFLEN